jgi:hypothetical protein
MLMVKFQSSKAEDHGLNNPVCPGANQLVATL